MHHLKFVEGSDSDIEGLLMPFGGPIAGKDITGEYFSPHTQFHLTWYDGDLPLLYHHGLDQDVQADPVGRITSIKMTDDGGWMKGQLSKASAYYAAVKKLIEQQALGLSSGSIPHLVRKAADGEILQWPVVEGSLTPTPACPGYATVDFATAEKHFKSAGIDLDADTLKAAMDASQRNALSDSDFAYIDSEGGRHLPVNDEAHARDALSRWSQTNFPDADTKKKALRKIIAAAKKFNVDVSDEMQAAAKSASLKCSFEDLIDELTDQLNPVGPGSDGVIRSVEGTYPDHVDVCCYEPDGDGDYDKSWWRYPYTHDDSDPDNPVTTLGTPVRLQLAPADEPPEAKALAFDTPFVMTARHVLRQTDAMKSLMTTLAERFVQEDRPISSAKRRAYEQVASAWEGGATVVRDRLAAVTAKEHATADAVARQTPEAIRRRVAALDLFLDTSA